MSGIVSVERLRELLTYDPSTGKLYWLPRKPEDFEATANRSSEHLCKWWNKRFAGVEAFTGTGGAGARMGGIFGVLYYAHRVAFAIYHQRWPINEIDHINGDRTDNRIANLRDVTHGENMRNKRHYRSKSNTYPGVVRRKSGSWQALIGGSGARTCLGTFPCFGAAVRARKAAERTHGYHANHGRAA